ncbi:MAG: hypothetical protein KH037_11610 [Burkholderiales bacterium]|uniref:hypothetical protein n=1 Tax=uncultured Turicimonas sp. TaxID=1918607 RepID=UPI001EBAB3E0|nr:hypothetical protein [uncultured Turicimonas sp.]MBS4847302.1 hypothetical protein [Burkholderiales bacterium]
MKDFTKVAWGVFGGALLGFVASSAISRGKLRPCTTKLMSYGLDWKDKLIEGAETFKEDLEDMTAEAKEEAKKRAARRQQEARAQNVSSQDVILPEDTAKEGK